MGIEFVGFRVWSTHRKLRKTSAKKLKRGLKWIQRQYAEGNVTLDQIRPNLMSYMGVTQHFNSYKMRKKISETFVLQRASPKEQEKRGKEVE